MNRIRALRKKNKLTQLQVGKYLGVGNTAVSMYETGQRHLDEETVSQLCRLFGCTADYLLGRSPSPMPVISPEDAAVLDAYHALPLEIRKAVDGLLEPYRAGVAEEKLDA